MGTAHLTTNPTGPGASAPVLSDRPRTTADHLIPFDDLYAPLIASWVRSDAELVWLAPGTPPPLTPAKVWAWQQGSGEGLLFIPEGRERPGGYAEINRMPQRSNDFWIGHCLVDPEHRGRGFGMRFVSLLLARAFRVHGADAVLLVVFPDNRPAIRCYERCGLLITGTEQRHFKATRRNHNFLRMAITRQRFEQFQPL